MAESTPHDSVYDRVVEPSFFFRNVFFFFEMFSTDPGEPGEYTHHCTPAVTANRRHRRIPRNAQTETTLRGEKQSGRCVEKRQQNVRWAAAGTPD